MSDKERSTVLDVAAPMPSDRDPSAACLIVIYGEDLGQRIALGLNVVVCGRETDCTVQLDDDRVSRRHAQFKWAGHGFLVEDMGSTNGTFVNNAAIQRAELRDGDQIKIGRTIYKFVRGGSAEAQYHEIIYQLMTCDGLTKAFNKRYFDQALEREISRARRYRRPLALLMADIDHFKSINDQYGHMAGDEVLRQFAAVLARNIRREDLLARVGGEEFAVLVPEGTTQGGRLFAERLRRLVEQTSFEFEGKTMRVTCSFGIAELDEDDREASEAAAALYKAADERLYAAKRAGRNRVESNE